MCCPPMCDVLLDYLCSLQHASLCAIDSTYVMELSHVTGLACVTV